MAERHRRIGGAREGGAGLPPRRRTWRAALLCLGLLAAGCQQDPAFDYLGGIGDPIRGAAFYAPRNLGDMRRYAGKPGEAAMAAAQLEFLASALPENPRYADVSPSVIQQLQMARTEMRGAIGIRQDAPPDAVIDTLRRAGAALRDGSRARAEAALSSPDFPAGPDATIARLGNLPQLPRTAEAAGAVSAAMSNTRERGRGP